MSERHRAPVPRPENNDASSSPTTKLAPLSQRLPGMTDRQLVAHQMSAQRISRDPAHPKHAVALHAVPLIDAELRKRAEDLEAVAAKGAALAADPKA
jgi:hypothetical protein